LVSWAKWYSGWAPYLTMVAPSVRAVVLSWDLAALPEAVGAPLVSSGGQATAHAS